jgi:uncharacterized protein (TIGR02147 family)
LQPISEHTDYKAYLQGLIRSLPKQGHGVRLRLAEALGCQSTYISQVLKGHAHFSLEQIEKIARFFSLSESEAEFFLLLVQENKAGTKELKAIFRKQRERLINERKKMKERFRTPQPLSEEQQARYYSSWHYAAIHILTTIPRFRRSEQMRQQLRLPARVVSESLDFLLSAGLVKLEGDEYFPGVTRIYLGGDSPLIAKHHQNWRLKAMSQVEEASAEDLHYSSVVSLSERDYKKVRETLLKTLDGLRETIRDSKEEKLCGLCLDFFGL